MATWIAYLAAAPLLIRAGGTLALGSALLLPVLITAWSLGLRLGLLAALASLPVWFALADLMTPAGGLAHENHLGRLVGAVVLLIAAGLAGRMRELSLRLEEAESRYRSLIDGVPAIIYIGRPGQLGVEYISPQVEALTGYPAHLWQAGSRSLWQKCIHPDDRAAALAAYERTMRSGEPFDHEYRFRGRDGRIAWVHDQARVLVDTAGRPRLVQGVMLDITAQKAGDLAREQNEAKSRFLANMSHELRTPLNAILGFSQLLADPGFGPLNHRQHRYVANIDSAGHHLLDLVNQILDLAKVQSGRLEAQIDELEVEPILSEAMSSVRPRAAAAGLALSVACDPGLRLRGDRLRLLQVLLNLLSNAVKFTPSGYVSLVATAAAGEVRIAIRDSGLGIPLEDQESIFEEFTQVQSGKTRIAEGTGLGLALSREMAALMGGRIELSSSPGQGSTFTVVLPGIGSPQ